MRNWSRTTLARKFWLAFVVAILVGAALIALLPLSSTWTLIIAFVYGSIVSDHMTTERYVRARRTRY